MKRSTVNISIKESLQTLFDSLQIGYLHLFAHAKMLHADFFGSKIVVGPVLKNLTRIKFRIMEYISTIWFYLV